MGSPSSRPEWDAFRRALGEKVATRMVVAARNPCNIDELLADVESPRLLPNPQTTPAWTWEGLRRGVVRVQSDERVALEKVRELLGLTSKKREFQELSEVLFPPRTKTDLSLRRTRLLDWVKLFKQHDRLNEVELVLSRVSQLTDLIWVTNILAAVWFFGLLWFTRWVSLGAFSAGIDHYIEVTKWVHDRVKTRGLRDANWLRYVECNGLTGYRCPPFPGFDVRKEAASLADGGVEHNLFGRSWDDLCRKYLPMRVKAVPFVPFHEWVESGVWLTSGASSVGRMEVLCQGKVVSIKARKNMVCDVVDLRQLADDAVAAVKQTSVTIIKSELGKIRLAVAGDIYTYLKMAWINHFLNGAYYQWPGNTSEESFSSQTRRMLRMLELCSKMFGLPYDYKAFDHQPTLEELVGIVRHLIGKARDALSPAHWAAFDTISSTVIAGFRNAELVTHDGADTYIDKVTGGLMSGLRWTSTIGNAWNSVITGLVMDVVASWGFSVESVERYIRGDDSAIFTDSWMLSNAMNLGYQSVGAIAGEGKFSIQAGAVEFLRVWYEDRCYGYAPRVIPSLTQRKPWSNQPWSEDMMLRALHEALRTLRRRDDGCVDLADKAWAFQKRLWCRDHSLPETIVSTPVYSGGLGIEAPPVGISYRASPRLPRVDPLAHLSIVNQTSWRATHLDRYVADRYPGLVVDTARVSSVEAVSSVVSDNVPSLAKVLRKAWLSEVRTSRIRVVATRTRFPSVPETGLTHWSAEAFDGMVDSLRASAPLFGAAPELATARADYSRFSIRTSFTDFLRKYYPRASDLLTRFHNSWHISEKIDYLSGSLAVCPVRCHPALTFLVQLMVAGVQRPARRAYRCASVWLSSWAEFHVLSTDLSRRVYSW